MRNIFPKILQTDRDKKVPRLCAPACVRAILKYYGDSIPTESKLAEVLKTTKDGTLPSTIIDFLRGKGYKVRAKHKMSIRSLKYYIKKGIPVMVPFDDHYYVVTDCTKDGVIYLMDPINYERVMAFENFQNAWHDKDENGARYKRFGIIVERKEDQ